LTIISKNKITNYKLQITNKLQRENKQKNKQKKDKRSNKFEAAALGSEAASFCFEF